MAGGFDGIDDPHPQLRTETGKEEVKGRAALLVTEKKDRAALVGGLQQHAASGLHLLIRLCEELVETLRRAVRRQVRRVAGQGQRQTPRQRVAGKALPLYPQAASGRAGKVGGQRIHRLPQGGQPQQVALAQVGRLTAGLPRVAPRIVEGQHLGRHALGQTRGQERARRGALPVAQAAELQQQTPFVRGRELEHEPPGLFPDGLILPPQRGLVAALQLTEHGVRTGEVDLPFLKADHEGKLLRPGYDVGIQGIGDVVVHHDAVDPGVKGGIPPETDIRGPLEEAASHGDT